ncbi:MAG: hypothetical protein WCI55_07990 [Armatimonadota bacterium]
MPPFLPTEPEQQRRDEVMTRVLRCIRSDERIKLPEFNPTLDRPTDQFALLSIGLEPNDFSGSVGGFRYQFEGEEDLLHLIVTADNQGELKTEDSQAVAAFVLRGMPSALIWLKPGGFSTHFYFGHDELLKNVID